MRFFLCFLSFVLLLSCDYFYSPKNRNVQSLDTIVDFKKVDVFPSFKVCDKLLGQAKTRCFRINIHQQIAKNLKSFEFKTEEDINELIIVSLLIDKTGNVSLKNVEVSEFTENRIPNLAVYIKKSIASLPTLSPAIKRGIPVATQYKLPVRIKTK